MHTPKKTAGAIALGIFICVAFSAVQVLAGIRFSIEPNTRVVQMGEAIKKANSSALEYYRSPVLRVGDGVVPRGMAAFVLGDGGMLPKN